MSRVMAEIRAAMDMVGGKNGKRMEDDADDG